MVNWKKKRLLHFFATTTKHGAIKGKVQEHFVTYYAGKISAKLAKEKVDQEYDKFKERSKNSLSPVEIHFLDNFEREQKRLMKVNGDKRKH